MEWEAVIVAVAAALGNALQRIQPTRRLHLRRDLIRKDVELLNMLDKETAARSKLEAHVNDEIDWLIDDEHSPKKSSMDIGMGIFFLALAAWTGWLAFGGTNWWSVAAVLFALIGLTSLTTDPERSRR